jgi:hypothetical protein
MFASENSDSLQQLQRVDAQLAGDALDGPQRQVPLTALDSAHLGPVNAEDISARLLAQPLDFTIGPEVPSQGPLQVALHGL